ncbi:hypothetical protein chiPu_0016829 [Chiloscyllium punctatum]|uniref:BZIP domain-containing protein n=1 Tax=Chiloscyllium punctatum TaxID=137246 RepID=A0A401T6R1_CHIPU|nr:hypothetical protein [Chiloscyllium punctatum]
MEITIVISFSDACLYDCETMEEMDDPTDLFHCFDNITEFNADLDLNLNMDIETSDLPWSQLNGDIYSDLRVKLEPLSPASSRCSDSSLASSCDIPLLSQLSMVKKENETSPVKQGPAIQPATNVKANSISCNKQNIQPQPVVATTLSTAPATSPAKTIMLQSVQTSLPVSQQQSLPLKQTVPGTRLLPFLFFYYSIKLLKRQQRMIKNRESACQSRKKKKEYLQGLESKLREALSENEKLKRENSLLKKKLDSIMSENTELKLGSGNRKAVCVMVFLLFVTFTFGPASITEKKPDLFQKTEDSMYIKRHLLAFKEEPGTESETEEATKDYAQREKFSNITMAYSDVKDLVLRDIDRILFPSSDCRQFNKTESLRLADELRGWVHRHQIERTKSNEKPKRQKKFKQSMRTQQRKINLSRFIPVQSAETSTRLTSSQLQVYQSPEQSYYDFMDAIDRREDTFYVVSFRRDHLLLPAISHNKTNRPKMSLVMPAMAVNESLHNTTRGYEVMMQIDCEVMDTRIIQIKSSSVPPSLRQPQHNGTGSYHPHSNASRAPSARRLRPQPLPVSASSTKDPLYLTTEDGEV